VKSREKDQDERALLLLLWGRKGWKGYSDLTHRGFSIEKLLKFLRDKKKAGDHP
jgi:hypothetical protein